MTVEPSKFANWQTGTLKKELNGIICHSLFTIVFMMRNSQQARQQLTASSDTSWRCILWLFGSAQLPPKHFCLCFNKLQSGLFITVTGGSSVNRLLSTHSHSKEHPQGYYGCYSLLVSRALSIINTSGTHLQLKLPID